MFSEGMFVKVERLPSSLGTMEKTSQKVFRKILGHTFKVQGLNDQGLLQLNVGRITRSDKKAFMETVWIEPDCVRALRGSSRYQPPKKEQLVSIVSESYLLPISILLDRLLSREGAYVNDVKSSSRECGYSASICLLAVVMLESCVVRARYLEKDKPIKNEKQAMRFIEAACPDINKEVLNELFVIRDVLAHNHLYVVDYRWIRDKMTFLGLALDPLSGDKKHKAAIGKENRFTKILGLNLVPIRVCRQDVAIVLREVWNVIMQLDAYTGKQLGMNGHEPFRNKNLEFGEIVKVVCSEVLGETNG